VKTLVIGSRGQLGRTVARRGGAIVGGDLPELDICDEASVARALDRDQPALVINAAAYTAVDKAESERDRAFAANRDGAGIVANACAQRRIRLLHVSTDYVFDGTATQPYREDDPLAPLGVYGESKAEGEQVVHEAGGTVVRTSWLFAEGGPSFVHTMVRLARERELLRVVADQRGCPTYAGDLADALIELGTRPKLAATYHYCNSGATTWHGFARAIVEAVRGAGPVACERVEAITTADYPTPAKRPAYSVLDTTRIRSLGIEPPHWQLGLQRVIAHDFTES